MTLGGSSVPLRLPSFGLLVVICTNGIVMKLNCDCLSDFKEYYFRDFVSFFCIYCNHHFNLVFKLFVQYFCKLMNGCGGKNTLICQCFSESGRLSLS